MSDILETGFDRAAKNIARTRVFDGLPRLTSVMSLPSSQRLCIRTLEEQRVIDETTRQVWIERDDDIYFGLSEIAGDNTQVLHTKLEDFAHPETFDLINADLMDSFGPRQAFAVQNNLCENIAENGTFILWCAAWSRNGKITEFRNWFMRTVQTDFGWLHDELMEGVNEAMAQHRGTMHDPESIRDSLLLTLAMFRMATARYTFRVAKMGSYRDGVPMLVLRFEDFEKVGESTLLPLFSAVYSDYQEKVLAGKRTQEEQSLMALISARSAGSHEAIKFEDDEHPRWMLISPNGKTIKTSTSLASIAAFYE